MAEVARIKRARVFKDEDHLRRIERNRAAYIKAFNLHPVAVAA